MDRSLILNNDVEGPIENSRFNFLKFVLGRRIKINWGYMYVIIKNRLTPCAIFWESVDESWVYHTYDVTTIKDVSRRITINYYSWCWMIDLLICFFFCFFNNKNIMKKINELRRGEWCERIFTLLPNIWLIAELEWKNSKTLWTTWILL